MTADIGSKFTDRDCPYWTVVWEVNGFNGVGGFWVTESWNWKNGRTCRSSPRTLSFEQSARLVQLGSLFKEGPLQ